MEGKYLSLAFLLLLVASAGFQGCAQVKTDQGKMKSLDMNFKVSKTNEEWKKQLTPLQYSILREKATERPFTGHYDKFYERGTYYCAGCGAELFESATKFDSGCGWPAFYDPSKPNHVKELPDTSHGMIRTEVVCASCGGHLGHVFDDGPEPTGKRYCINSASLEFRSQKSGE